MSMPLQCNRRGGQFRLCPHFPYPPLPYTLQGDMIPKDNSFCMVTELPSKTFSYI